MPPKQVMANYKCKKCSVSVKTVITCSGCKSNYHPACLLKICGAYVDANAQVFCCRQSVTDCGECKKKVKEINQLKERVSILNKKQFDESLPNGTCITVTEDSETTETTCDELLNFIHQSQATLLDELNVLKEKFDDLSIAFERTSSTNGSDKNCNIMLMPDPVLEQPKNASSRVLLLSDSHGRHCSSILSEMMADSYEVSSIVKPNAIIEDVVADLQLLARDFDKNDHVIILGGTNNILKGMSPDPAFWRTRPIYNRTAYDFNMKLYMHAINAKHVHFMDVNQLVDSFEFTRHGLHMKLSGKKKLMAHLAYSIDSTQMNMKTCNINSKNLIYIKTSGTSFDDVLTCS